MSGLHEPSQLDLAERFPLDMDQVSRDALASLTPRRWRLEFDCEGAPFIWSGLADSEAEAVSLGRLAIYMDGRHDQDKARPVACFEVRS